MKEAPDIVSIMLLDFIRDGYIISEFNLWTIVNASMGAEHYAYCYPGAKAPGHRYPECKPNIHCIGPVSDKNITFIVTNIRK